MAEMMADADSESVDDVTDRIHRKRSGYLSRLDEDSAMNDSLLSPSRHLTRRSISRELFGGSAVAPSDHDQRSSAMSPTSSITGSRPVTRRSISRELFDYNPTSSVTGGRITPTFGLVGSSPARRTTNIDYSRNSRERSLGRDNDYNDRTTTSSRSLGSSRRSESLTRGGTASLTSPSASLTTTSRPSLSTQGRSLTQSEFVRTSPRGSVSGRISAGIDDDSRIRLSDRVSSGSGYGGSSDYGRSSGYSGSIGLGDRGSSGSGYSGSIGLGDRGSSGSGYSGSTSLNDRGRSDWRRVSVPERGKDYSSLQSKYKR